MKPPNVRLGATAAMVLGAACLNSSDAATNLAWTTTDSAGIALVDNWIPEWVA